MPSAAWARKIAREVVTELRKADRGTKGLRGFRKVRTSKIPQAQVIKPATRPRYSPTNFNEAILAAARISAKYNKPMFVYPSRGGYGITYREHELSAHESYAEVDGRAISYWVHKDVLAFQKK